MWCSKTNIRVRLISWTCRHLFSPFLPVSLPVSVCLPVCLSVCVFVCLFVSLGVIHFRVEYKSHCYRPCSAMSPAAILTAWRHAMTSRRSGAETRRGTNMAAAKLGVTERCERLGTDPPPRSLHGIRRNLKFRAPPLDSSSSRLCRTSHQAQGVFGEGGRQFYFWEEQIWGQLITHGHGKPKQIGVGGA